MEETESLGLGDKEADTQLRQRNLINSARETFDTGNKYKTVVCRLIGVITRVPASDSHCPLIYSSIPSRPVKLIS